jgi:hypothetical protein
MLKVYCFLKKFIFLLLFGILQVAGANFPLTRVTVGGVSINMNPRDEYRKNIIGGEIPLLLHVLV